MSQAKTLQQGYSSAAHCPLPVACLLRLVLALHNQGGTGSWRTWNKLSRGTFLCPLFRNHLVGACAVHISGTLVKQHLSGPWNEATSTTGLLENIIHRGFTKNFTADYYFPAEIMGPPHFESPSVKTYPLLGLKLLTVTFKQFFSTSEISFVGFKVFPCIKLSGLLMDYAFLKNSLFAD